MFVLPFVALLLCRSLSQDTEPVQETQTGGEGRTLSLQCGFPDVTWLKNVRGVLKDVMTLGDRRYIVTEDGTMRISNLRKSDKGVYSCTRFYTPIKDITVTISARPTFSISPSDVTAHYGSLVHLPCAGSGDPKPSIGWKVGKNVQKNMSVIEWRVRRNVLRTCPSSPTTYLRRIL